MLKLVYVETDQVAVLRDLIGSFLGQKKPAGNGELKSGPIAALPVVHKDKKSAARNLYETDPSLSITEVAERVGVSSATIYAWRKSEAWERAGD